MAEAQPISHDLALSPPTAPVVRHPTSTRTVPCRPQLRRPPAPQRSGCDEDGDLCLAPRVDVAEQRVAYGSRYEIEFDLSSLLRSDPETRWASHKIATETRVLDTDEVREIEGYNPRDDTSAEVPA